MGANPNVIKDNQDAVNRMQKFIADHLREPITQFQLSRAAGYSEYYARENFQRNSRVKRRLSIFAFYGSPKLPKTERRQKQSCGCGV